MKNDLLTLLFSIAFYSDMGFFSNPTVPIFQKVIEKKYEVLQQGKKKSL